MAVVWGANEVLHPGVIGVGPEVDLKVGEDSGEGLEVEQHTLLWVFTLELGLGVADKLLDVEHTGNASLDLVLLGKE